MANREALGMVQSLRDDVQAVLDWQRSVLARMNEIAPETGVDGATVVDFLPDSMSSVDVETFRQFVEASVAKLTYLLD